MPRQWNQSGLGSRLTYDLLGQGPAAAQEHSTRGGLEQGATLSRDEISAQNKHAAGRFMPLMPQARLAGPELGLQSGLEILSVGWGLFVQDQDINSQMLHPPVFVARNEYR